MKHYHLVLFVCLLMPISANCQSIDSIYTLNSFNQCPISPTSNYIKNYKIRSIEYRSFSYKIDDGDTIMDLELKAQNLSFISKVYFNLNGLATFITAEIRDTTNKTKIDTIKIFTYDNLNRLIGTEDVGLQREQIDWFIYPNSNNHWIRKHYSIKYYGSDKHLHKSSLTYQEKTSVYDSTSFYWCTSDTSQCLYTFDKKQQIESVVYEVQKGNEFHIPENGKFILKKKNTLKEILYFNEDNKLIKRVTGGRKEASIQDFYYDASGILTKMIESFMQGTTKIVSEHYYSYVLL